MTETSTEQRYSVGYLYVRPPTLLPVIWIRDDTLRAALFELSDLAGIGPFQMAIFSSTLERKHVRNT